MTDETLLLRQVHPAWIQEGRATSQTFRPTPKDKGKLSSYDGDLIEAFASWKHYAEQLKFASAGVLAVSVAECKVAELSVTSDPNPFPEHVLIHFAELTSGQIEKKSKRLRAAAELRGWKYGPLNPQ